MPTHSRKTTLLATDQHHSVLNALDADRSHAIAYSPYGYRPRENGLLSLLGFNGELPDPLTGHYHLGKGYRQFNPALMRFNSPDSWSPFGAGGVNSYGYCGGDPIDCVDPSGHASQFFLAIRNFFRSLRRPSTVEPILSSPRPETTLQISAGNPSLPSPAQGMRPGNRNPLANPEVNTPIAATHTSTSRVSVKTDEGVDRASFPPSYFPRPDSPPPIYRSNSLTRTPNTPREMPPSYEHAARDPHFDVRVITVRGSGFLKSAYLSAVIRKGAR